MKPGHKTTEFWITLAVAVLTSVAPFITESTDAAKIVGLLLSVASALGYTASRTSVKNNRAE